MKNILFFTYFDKFKYHSLLGNFFTIFLIFFDFKSKIGLTIQSENIVIHFITYFLLLDIFLIIIKIKANKFLRLIFFENYKATNLLNYKSQQMEAFNFMEFVWFNNEKNCINNNLKELLYRNKDKLIKGKEEMYSSSANNSSLLNSKNQENYLEVLSGNYFICFIFLFILDNNFQEADLSIGNSNYILLISLFTNMKSISNEEFSLFDKINEILKEKKLPVIQLI